MHRLPSGQDPIRLPKDVRPLCAGHDVDVVWCNKLGGTTFRLTSPSGVRYLKRQDYSGLGYRRRHVDLRAEAQRLAWAAEFTPAPPVLDYGENADAAWLLTAEVQGTPALPTHWEAEPETAVRAIASGLRRLHDSLPVDACPFIGSWAEHEDTDLPPPEHLVVCHGDPCVPNTLVSSDGEFAAHVDLGMLGVADRWSDLAIATYSISWAVNFGRSYDELFFATYGVEPDEERIAFYRDLWDAE